MRRDDDWLAMISKASRDNGGIDEEIDGVDVQDVEIVDESKPGWCNGVAAGPEVRNAVDGNRIDGGGGIQPKSCLQVPIEGDHLDAVSAGGQPATEIEDAAFNSSHFGVELPRHLQYSHHAPAVEIGVK